MLRLFANPRLQTGILICGVMLAGSVWAQSTTGADNRASEKSEKPVNAWVVINNGSANTLKPGSDAQTVEAVKTFAERCPNVGVTLERDKADFAVLVGHDPHRPWWRRDNKIAVFDRDGKEIYATSTRTMGNAVKNACRIISGYSKQVESSPQETNDKGN